MLYSQKKIIIPFIGGILSVASPSYCTIRMVGHTSPMLGDEAQLVRGCNDEKFQPLSSFKNCGQSAGYAQDILVWDQVRLTTPPKWKDLWDVVQLPGQRALPKSARLTLEVALLSDGVPPARIYKTLSTSRGVAHAFHRLDQLRPYIVWWNTPSEARALMQKKAFLIGVAPQRSMTSSAATPPPSLFITGAAYTLYTAQFSNTPQGTDATAPSQYTLTQPQDVPLSDKTLEIDNHFWTIHAPMLEARFAAWLRR